MVLPAAESLLVQFAGRTVYTSTDAVDERLTVTYWLMPPRDEGFVESESVRYRLMFENHIILTVFIKFCEIKIFSVV